MFQFPGTTPEVRMLDVRFTGSGSEYFRIWIVNLLLTIVTLGLYFPFAKARRLAYFHANTLVDGDALGFHGSPWKMFRGFLVMVVFAVVYGLAGQFSGAAALTAGGLFLLLWPALWRASLQFRLGNTRWRGLRLGFGGDLAGAYRASWPMLLPALLFLAGSALMPRSADEAASVVPWIAVLPLAGMLAALLLGPLWMARSKRYQHGHYRYADERTRMDAGTGSFYGLAFKTLGVALAVIAVAGVLGFGLAFAQRAGGAGAAAGIGLIGLTMLAYAAMFVLVWPFASARLQNLVWSGTRSRHLRFRSTLGVGALARLTAKNLLLTIVTLGFYRPFAAVATARLRLESVQIRAEGDITQWAARGAASEGDAAGDFAGDFFGIDIGL